MSSRSVLSAGVAVILGNVAVQLANLGRDISLATTFGSGLFVDCFLLATMVPVFLVTVATGAYRNTIVPILEGLASSRGTEAATRFVGRAMAVNLPVLICICVALALAVLWYGRFLTGQLPESANHFVIVFTWAMLPVFFFSTYASLADGPLQRHGWFFLPGVTRSAVPLGIALGAIVFGGKYGILGICIGGFTGAALQFLIATRLLVKVGALRSIRTPMDEEASIKIRTHFIFLSGSLAIMYVSPIIDQWMASFLGTGAVSALGYANRLAVGAGSMIAAAIGPVFLPVFSKLISEQRTEALSKHYFATVRLAFWGGFLLAGALWLVSEPAIALLYERGNFQREDTQRVADVLTYLSLQFPAYLPGVVAATLLSAAGQNKVFLPLTLLTAIVNALGNLVLMQWYGLAGIAISTGITYVVSLIAMNFCLTRRRVIVFPWTVGREAGVATMAAILIVVVITALDLKPTTKPSFSQISISITCLFLYAAVAYYFMRAVISPAMKDIRLLRRR